MKKMMIALVIILSVILFFVLLKMDFIIYHLFIDGVSIFLGFIIFVASFSLRKYEKDSFFTHIGVGILVSSIITFFHLITNLGLSNTLNYNENTSTQLLIWASLVQASAFIAGVLLTQKKYSYPFLLVSYLGIGICLIVFTFSGMLPDFVFEGEKTFTNMIIEILIILLYLITILFMYRKRTLFNKDYYIAFISALGLVILGEFMFALNDDILGLRYFFGHVLKLYGFIIISIVLIRRAVFDPIKTSVENLELEVSNIKKSEKTLRKSEQMFKELYQNVPLAYQSIDSDGRFLYINKAFTKMYGYEKEEVIGKHFDEVVAKSVFDVNPVKINCFYDLEDIDVIFDVLHKDNHIITTRFMGKVLSHPDGTYKQTHCILLDITKDKEHEKLLLDNEEKVSLILNSTEEGIFGIDLEDKCTFVNEGFSRTLGFKKEEVIGKTMHSLIHHTYANGLPFPNEECPLSQVLKEGRKLKSTTQLLWKKNGQSIKVEYSSNPQYKNSKLIGAVVSFKDITEKLEYQDTLINMSYTDSLTKLHNRRYFEEKIIEMDITDNYPLTIIMGDINGLKFINDSFGHDAGDEMLIEVSEIMKESCNDTSLISRMGGDEFVIVLPNSTEDYIENLIREMVIKARNSTIHSIPISISFGFKTKINNDSKIADVFKEAENEMYQSKLLKSTSMRSNATDTIMKTLNEKDNYSELHSRSVSETSYKLAELLGMPYPKIRETKVAGLLHDIGKIVIPSVILNKQGPLLDSEYDEMKKHPTIGFRILNTMRDMKNISRVILHHHERWDGQGYPHGISGDNIPVQSRIISIADAFDAMTSKRDYKEKISNEEALEEIIRNAGTQFDPEIVEVFKKGFKKII